MATMVEFAGTTVLNDGTAIQFRPIAPSDREALQRFHRRNSHQSIYQRFFSLMPELGDEQARRFTEVDGHERFALVALDPIHPGELIAVARFDRHPGTDRAEYAAIVADAWQGRGLGLELTRRLIEAARDRGVRAFVAYVLPDNLRMLNLLRDLGLPESIHFEDGVETVEVNLLGNAE